MIKRNSARDFAIFNTFAEYQSEYNDGPHVDDQTICFVSDTGKIYTHGDEFGGKGATYTGGDGINVNSSNVISIDTNWLRNQNLGGGGNYTITDFSKPSKGKLLIVLNTGGTKLVTLGLNDLEGVNIPNTVATGAVLKYNGQSWAPGTDNTGGGIEPGEPVTVYDYTSITTDLNPNSIIIDVDENGNHGAIHVMAIAAMYNNGDSNTVTDIELVDVVGSNGSQISNMQQYVSVEDVPNIVIDIPANTFDFSLFGNGITFKFKMECQINGVTVSGFAFYNMYAVDIFAGSGNVIVRVPAAVSSDPNNNNKIAPALITPYVEFRQHSGSNIDEIAENTIKLSATELKDMSDYRLSYLFDDATISYGNGGIAPNYQEMEYDSFNTNNAQNIPNATDNIKVALVKYNIQDGVKYASKIVGEECIPVIKQGKNGIDSSGISWDLQPRYSTVCKTEIDGEYFVLGEIGVLFYKVENGSRSIVTNDSDEYIEMYLGTRGRSLGVSFNEDNNEFICFVNLEFYDEDTFIEVVAYGGVSGEERLASIIIPVRIDGVDGTVDFDEKIQSLNFLVMRLRGAWSENPDPAYNNGSVVEKGVKYVDVVTYGNNYFRCTVAGTTNRPTTPIVEGDDESLNIGDGSKVNAGWSAFSYAPDAIYNYLIAHNAFIQSLTAEQIVITDDGNVVAGMANGHYIENNINDAGQTDNGIRIWAGPFNETGNVASAPFTVDNEGHLKAIDADLQGSLTVTDSIKTSGDKIKLNANGSGLLANGSMSWDENGNILFGYKEWESNGIIWHQYAGEININGSGSLANRNILWDANGNLTIHNIIFSGNVPTVTNNGVARQVATLYTVTPTLIAYLGDIITLPSVPDGTVYLILVYSTGHYLNGGYNNTVTVKCADDGSSMSEYYSGQWHSHIERDTQCLEVGMYFFVRKDGNWNAIFPY